MRSWTWVVAFLVVLGLADHAWAGDKCSASRVEGAYGIRTEGLSDFVPGSNPSNINDYVPIRSVGRVVFLEDGTLSGAEWANIGGLVLPFTYTGTYTVEPDCTGTLTRSISLGGPPEEARLVVTGRGRRMFLMGTFPVGRHYTGELERMPDE
jgi:hypothetical protein